MNSKSFINQEKSFDTGKVKINYLDYGKPSGTPLIMLPGGSWSWQEYISLIPSLAENYRIYAMDARGNGRSGWVPGRYSLADFTEDTSKFLDQLDKPAVLVGHSIGGVIALITAAKHPEKVKALILEDIVLTLENYQKVIDSSREMFTDWLKLKKAAKSEQDLALALAEYFRRYPGVTSQWTLYFAYCLWNLDPTYFDVLLNDFDKFTGAYDYKKILAKINCPILFVRGEVKLGAVMSDQEIDWLKKNYKNAKFAHIKNVGHLLHLQDEGQTPVLSEMMNFLKETR
jgi:pimeloyl-ACP methyl ester carboxylesterase